MVITLGMLAAGRISIHSVNARLNKKVLNPDLKIAREPLRSSVHWWQFGGNDDALASVNEAAPH